MTAAVTAPATLLAGFRARAETAPDRVAFRTLRAGGSAADAEWTWRRWHDEARACAAAFVVAGLAPGARVAILAGNHPVWPIADLGALMAGLVSVGIYPTSAPAQVRQILADAAAAVALADTGEQRRKITEARAALPDLAGVVTVEADGGETGVESWDAWLAAGAAALAADPALGAEIDRRIEAAQPDDDALLIYTSGSTGEPKGARISHRYLAESAASVRDTLGLTADDSTLSFLPFSHAGERVFGLYTRVLCGVEAALVPDHARIWEAARALRPTVFGGLPRFYEKAYERLEAERAALAPAERERWTLALELGRERSRRRRGGAPVSAELERAWEEAAAAPRARLLALFGGRVRLATSGGAALPREVAEYLDALGLTVLGAYGLTEHLCVAFHRPDDYDFEGVGRAMPGTAVTVAADGEILVRRSGLTFSGYHARPDDTAEAFTPDGAWLRTGDLGTIDADGRLHVTGRKKELIALSTGKKVAPAPIEARLAEDPWIAQAMLYGEGRKFVTALVALRRPVVEAWARAEGLGADFDALVGHPAVRERVQTAVDRVNAGLSRTEQVRRFALLDRELTLEAGELTPTLKLRRPLLAERYGDRLEALYL